MKYKYLWDTDICVHFLNGTGQILRFAKNKSQLRKKGVTVGDFDLLIAGFASVKNLCLVTNNIKHFNHIPNLKIENWLSE